MEFTIEYDIQPTPLKLFKINDISNFAIECEDTEGLVSYLVVLTSLGITYIYCWGAIIPDIDTFVGSCNFEFRIFDFKESKIENYIDTFINKRKYPVKDIRRIRILDAFDSAKSFKEDFKSRFASDSFEDENIEYSNEEIECNDESDVDE